ncbi:hypothetical protein CY34DRAFT_729238 [Suillus luteus UH-Slu-Lm8-n1]|uniref:Uncharacterized protein n=1 Tax=Suillus luteus UH-Slu-Lm8-n1 TaxID=930992 RepID=A0A0D0BZ98_9AGAM|nr:hypothetical protein CY34DRAFT_729238 [Suillus luteus UH-Slu-Lm8-n1]
MEYRENRLPLKCPTHIDKSFQNRLMSSSGDPELRTSIEDVKINNNFEKFYLTFSTPVV